jgi:hypothetical protein
LPSARFGVPGISALDRDFRRLRGLVVSARFGRLRCPSVAYLRVEEGWSRNVLVEQVDVRVESEARLVVAKPFGEVESEPGGWA